MRLKSVALIFLFIISGYWIFWSLQQAEASRRLPTDISLPSLSGSSVELSQFLGKPLVVNFWATWCPPCVREMPLLAEYAQQQGFRLVLINQAEPASKVQAFLDEAGLEFEFMLLDSQQTAYHAMQVRGLPTTQFFDPQGRLLNEHVGEIHQQHLDAFIKKHVNP